MTVSSSLTPGCSDPIASQEAGSTLNNGGRPSSQAVCMSLFFWTVKLGCRARRYAAVAVLRGLGA